MDNNLERHIDQLVAGVVLPEIQSVSKRELRQKDAYKLAMPPMTRVGSDALSGYSTKARDAAQLAQAIGLAYGETKAYLKRNREISKAEERNIDRNLNRRNRITRKQLKGLSSYNSTSRNRSARRFAGDYLGMGRDLIKVIV